MFSRELYVLDRKCISPLFHESLAGFSIHQKHFTFAHPCYVTRSWEILLQDIWKWSCLKQSQESINLVHAIEWIFYHFQLMDFKIIATSLNLHKILTKYSYSGLMKGVRNWNLLRNKFISIHLLIICSDYFIQIKYHCFHFRHLILFTNVFWKERAISIWKTDKCQSSLCWITTWWKCYSF